MPTPHNQANLGDIAKTVIMPGDPLRAKYIAETFLQQSKLVNDVRGMFAYTGIYKNTPVTVMASGMGMPSIGIYAYELYQFYEVETIIRIGSCGAYQPDINLLDIILAEQIFTESTFAYTLNNDDCHITNATSSLNTIIEHTAQETQVTIRMGNTICMDCLDTYMTDFDIFWKRIPKDFNPIAAEMEAFALFYIANLLHKKASCLMSVVDAPHIHHEVSSSQRQNGLNTMIQLALDSATKL